MIIHQHVSVDSGPEALAQYPQQLQEVKPVRIVAENGLAFVAPSRT